jgi:hypothetical protein
MGNQQNLPHHGSLRPRPNTTSSNQFTEKRLLDLKNLPNFERAEHKTNILFHNSALLPGQVPRFWQQKSNRLESRFC